MQGLPRFSLICSLSGLILGLGIVLMLGKYTYGCTQYSDDTEEGSCSRKLQFNINLNLQKQTREVVMMKNLPRIDPVKVGHTREVHLFPGKTHQMQTLALNPPVFEVKDFLTDEECELIINVAKRSDLKESTTVRTNTNRWSIEHIMELFVRNDLNKDGILDKYEVGEMFIKLAGLMFGDEELQHMLTYLELDTDRDGKLSDKELFLGLQYENYDKFYEYLENMQDKNPERKVRYSDTVFLEPSRLGHLFEDLRRRIVNLTGLPYGMIKAGEHLQVVRYRARGHYHSHLDSEASTLSKECCQYSQWKRGCTLCRYMTVLYFLNDVEEGGETAFPIADNETVDAKILFGKERRILDLGRHCHDANMYYTPKKRSALIWYNHKVDPKTGWFGDVDIRSLHGGCNVIKGSKWIANNWIDASREYSSDIDLFVKSLFDKSLS